MLTINVAKDFSRYPGGRVREDGPNSGEAFREAFLEKPLREGQKIRLEMDGTRGYGSSFLEEVFGGLVRSGIEKRVIDQCLKIITDDPALVLEIEEYVDAADA